MTIPFNILKNNYNLVQLLDGKYGQFHILSIDPSKGKSNNLAIRLSLYDYGYVRTISMMTHSCDNNQMAVYNLLNNYDLGLVRLIIVERQLLQNPQALYQSKYILCYCCSYVNATVIEVDSRLKYNWFNCPKELKGKEKKKWGVYNSIVILEASEDRVGIEIINNCNKQDDVADTVTQERAVLEWIDNNRRKL